MTATGQTGTAVPGLHSAVFSAISEAVLVTDLDGVVIDVNPAAEAMFGLTREQLLGTVPAGVSDPERAQGRLREMLDAVRRGEQWATEVPFRRADGQLRLSDRRVVGVRDERGELMAAVAVNRDVTDERRSALAVYELEERWRLTLDGAPSGIALVALDGTFLRVNEALCRMLGYREAELLGLTFQDITHPDDLEADLDLLAQLVDGRIERYTLDKRYRHADGRCVWTALTVGLINDPVTLEPLHFVSQMMDTTERALAAETARAAAARQTAVIAAQLAIADADLAPQKVMHEICSHAQHLTGAEGAVIELLEGTELVYRAVTGTAGPHLGLRVPLDGSLSGLTVQQSRALSCDDTLTDARVNAESCRRVGVRSMLLVPLRQRDRTLGVLKVVSSEPHRFTGDDQVTLELLAAPFGAALGNATHLERTTQQALTDTVTGLANRSQALRELDRGLERQQRRGGHTAVIFCDLDRFKAVNDTLGHAAGDQLLVAVADRLRAAVRTTDTPARYGGDEFLIVCDGLAAPEDVEVLAQRLLRTVPGRYVLAGGEGDVGLSIGIAVADGVVTADDLLVAADKAMYDAKRAGGDRSSTVHCRPADAAAGTDSQLSSL